MELGVQATSGNHLPPAGVKDSPMGAPALRAPIFLFPSAAGLHFSVSDLHFPASQNSL